jgi:hypothetical protein
MVNLPSDPVVARCSVPDPARTTTAAPETTAPVESWTTPETVPSAANTAIRANAAIIMALDYTVCSQQSAVSVGRRTSGSFGPMSLERPVYGSLRLGALDASSRAKFLDADFEGVHERNFLLVG